MVKLHTSQLNFGKVVKGKKGIGFLDTTVRTGSDFVKAYIAPTWDMVKGAHSGQLDWYSDVYLERLESNKEVILRALEGWAKKAELTDMVLGCYDAENKFCHRHLLKRFLLNNSSLFIRGGEVSKDTIYRGDIPRQSVILVAGSEDVRRAVFDIVRTDVGNHACSDVSVEPITDAVTKLAKIAAIHDAVENHALSGTMPYIDFSELGNVLLTDSGIEKSGDVVTCQGPRVGSTVPWHIVFGDTKQTHTDIRSLMFTQAFELCPIVNDTDFEKEMDDYYNRSIIDAKSGDA